MNVTDLELLRTIQEQVGEPARRAATAGEATQTIFETRGATPMGAWATATVVATGVTGTADITNTPASRFSLLVKAEGTKDGSTAWTVLLEGSINGTDWATLLTHTYPTTGDGVFAPAVATFTPVRHLRFNVSALTLGTATGLRLSGGALP